MSEFSSLIKDISFYNKGNETEKLYPFKSDVLAFNTKSIANLPNKEEALSINLNHKLKRIKREIKFAKAHFKKYQKLTLREKEIIKLLASGNNNPKIAEQLFISRSTVEQHRKNINAKLCVKSFPQLMLYIYAFDII